LIEFFVFRNLSLRFMGVNEEFDMDSDHLPIALMLSETIIKTRTKFNPLEQTN